MSLQAVPVLPAKAGTSLRKGAGAGLKEIPAFAGMTKENAR
jgi:hypothetical protein